MWQQNWIQAHALIKNVCPAVAGKIRRVDQSINSCYGTKVGRISRLLISSTIAVEEVNIAELPGCLIAIGVSIHEIIESIRVRISEIEEGVVGVLGG
jgi:hypothetical protein